MTYEFMFSDLSDIVVYCYQQQSLNRQSHCAGKWSSDINCYRPITQAISYSIKNIKYEHSGSSKIEVTKSIPLKKFHPGKNSNNTVLTTPWELLNQFRRWLIFKMIKTLFIRCILHSYLKERWTYLKIKNRTCVCINRTGGRFKPRKSS